VALSRVAINAKPWLLSFKQSWNHSCRFESIFRYNKSCISSIKDAWKNNLDKGIMIIISSCKRMSEIDIKWANKGRKKKWAYILEVTLPLFFNIKNFKVFVQHSNCNKLVICFELNVVENVESVLDPPLNIKNSEFSVINSQFWHSIPNLFTLLVFTV